MRSPVIGLTGPTGAGKSTVAAEWRMLGCAVIDADRIAREATERPDCITALAAEFGGGILEKSGALNRQQLARTAFSSPEKTARLNAIVHPRVLEEVLRRIEAARKSGAAAIVLDVPLLFESGSDRLCDVTVAVLAPQEVRLARIMRRDSISEELARSRIGAQHGEDYFRERADYVFEGEAAMDSLPAAAKALFERIMGELHETS